MQLKNDYQRDDFLEFLEEDFLTDFKKDIKPVNTSGLTSIQKAYYLGESKNLDLQVFEFLFEGSPNKRIALTKDAFTVMRSSAIFRALAIFHSSDNKDWRFSLMTATPEPTEKGKVALSYSNPKRLSFFLGTNARINTPTKFLITKGKISSFEDLKGRFSIEVVNKEFYKEVSHAFTKLVDGLLKLPSSQDKSRLNLEFAVRLIGRIIFCWFLREKKSPYNLALMPQELLSLEAVKENDDYYHKILEPIFFEVLNKPSRSRRVDFAKEPFSSVPYLNGGLFSPQDDDYYKRTNDDFQSQYHNTLVIPDDWFKDFFIILETYNFTIDENTSYDEELSIDPEMLGRIFENLLAEINPETGESARKSTGSYYTPRIIVNYMVDESLLLYLKEKTGIEEEKLRAIISYDLDDDLENPVTPEDKEKIIDALEKVKILDPACGSGAFPMGALQKIVFILQQTDPDGFIWKNKQLAKADPEFRRDIETRFSNNEIDFLRKLAIIRKSVYGIDIQPIATEISRLRCFLTLIVDEKINDDEDNRGIRPLPNLDFKFVTANSLIGLPKIDQPQQSLLDDYKGIGELKAVRDQYFTASGIEREQLKTEFSEKQNELINEMLANHDYAGYAKSELTRKLTSWRPFKHTSSDWFDPEWMFGIKDGFDIVIANPPYINIANIKNEGYRKTLANNFSVAKNKTDLYAFFAERGLEILKGKGKLAYIFSNSWLGTDSFSKFREFLVNNTKVEKLVKCQPGVFEKATVTVVIIILTKETVTNNDIDLLEFDGSRFHNLDFNLSYDFIRNQVSYGFTFDKPIEINIPCIKLGEIAKFSLGIKTADDKRFISDSKKETDSYKLLRGKDMGGYFSKFSGKWMWYKPDLMNQRKGAGPRHLAYFLRPKILIKDIAVEIQATIDTEGYLTTDTIAILYEIKDYDLKFILALLNSKLINKWFKMNFPAGLHIKTNQLENIPIPKKVDQIPFVTLVDKILAVTNSIDYHTVTEKQARVKYCEKQIDQLVYKLYGLADEEIRVVGGKT